MTLRNLLRKDSHFLVKYLCDDKLQVRSRNHIRDTNEVLVSRIYEVQWGRQNEVATAKIIASGTDNQMRLQLREIAKGHPQSPASSSPPSSPSPLPSPRSPTPPPPTPPPPPRRVTSATTVQSKKPQATLIGRTGPPVENNDFTTLLPAAGLVRAVTEEVETTPITSVATPITSVSLVPAYSGTRRVLFADEEGALPMLDKILSGVQSLNERVAKVETKLNKVQCQQDKLFQLLMRNNSEPVDSAPLADMESVPNDLQISAEKLQVLRRLANSAGHFGKMLVQEYFPELFGTGNLRTLYSWNGGGVHDKKELDPVRKTDGTKVCRTVFHGGQERKWFSLPCNSEHKRSFKTALKKKEKMKTTIKKTSNIIRW